MVVVSLPRSVRLDMSCITMAIDGDGVSFHFHSTRVSAWVLRAGEAVSESPGGGGGSRGGGRSDGLARLVLASTKRWAKGPGALPLIPRRPPALRGPRANLIFESHDSLIASPAARARGASA